jgi:hypothetical protein
MKNNLVKLFAGVVLFALSQVAYAASPNISTMAEILIHLNHYPSSAEKQVLSGIAENESATMGEQALAGAILEMEHQISASAAKNLRVLSEDNTAGAEERTLADILLEINHKPSAKDKQLLQGVMK